MSDTKKVIRAVLNLSSTIVEGRYKLTYREYPIKKETEKTVVIIKNKREDRVMRTDLLIAKSDFTNDRLSKLQFICTCLEEDMDKCIEVLSCAMDKAIKEISSCHLTALAAYNNKFTISKLD